MICMRVVVVVIMKLHGEGVAFAIVDEVAFTGNAAMNAAVSAMIMLIQNTGLTSPAFIAPGTTAITRLSTTSIVRMESVSVANTTLRAEKNPSPP